MLTPLEAERLRELIARHAHCQFRAGRLTNETDPDVRARVYAAADAANRAICSALSEMTKEETDYAIL
jgi:hypothetical protein